MEVSASGRHIDLASSNMAELAYATDRLKEEHEQLRNRLRVLETSAKEVMLLNDVAKSLQMIQKLRNETAQFELELERHSEWEEQRLFPFLLNYFHIQQAPTIRPSFWVLEKDHQLGVSFIQSFHETMIDTAPLGVKKQLTEAASALLQACLILNDHFAMEEQLILPLTEKVLTDLEYFFS
ncbi:hemerythrin domain-containing protein [Paenibacillus sp. TAB 01]|uniref:hemerythrin domain-containing protein n=1 Tax=Paenibacillus sp. TAB 01 TaxID=3368988 RepID=UPI0037528177